jgi:hypothetical protein
MPGHVWRSPYGATIMHMMMIRTTIMLPADLRLRSSRRARERGMSFGELVRASLVAEIDQARGEPASDPLFADNAVYSGPAPRDLAKHHDAYLYGNGG